MNNIVLNISMWEKFATTWTPWKNIKDVDNIPVTQGKGIIDTIHVVFDDDDDDDDID